jgi:precorrin isomerase
MEDKFYLYKPDDQRINAKLLTADEENAFVAILNERIDRTQLKPDGQEIIQRFLHTFANMRHYVAYTQGLIVSENESLL